MQINVGPQSLGSLMGNSIKVTVPSFQRNYSWTKDQVNQFLDDIHASAVSGSGHFWGPIVLLRRPVNPNLLEVIDGQQRITTAIIFLSLLRDQALDLEDPWMNAGLPGAYQIPPVVRNFLFLPPLYSEQRFTGSYLIENVLKDRVIADPESPAPGGGNPVKRPLITTNGAGMSPAERKHSKELRAAYRQMGDWLRDTLAALGSSQERTAFVARLFQALTDNFEIHTMELVNEDDAYLLFESLNDRGLRLNPSDLLKTLTLREIRANPGMVTVEQGLDMWDEAVDALGDYDFTKFLRHYLLTQVDDTVQNRRIFIEFKEQIRKLEPQGALQNLQRLSVASSHYAQLLGLVQHPDVELRRSFERMNRYSDTHRVFLLGLLQSGLGVQDMQILSRAIEALSYRWIATGGNAQELETIYRTEIQSLISSSKPDRVQDCLEKIISLLPSDAQFKAVTRLDAIKLQRYLLLRIEESTGGAIAGNADVEHLAPRNPGVNGGHWYAAVGSEDQPDSFGETYDDLVRNWGNLTLLEDRLNRSISNSPWPAKVSGNANYKGISASNYNLNQIIKSKTSWSADEIRSREQWLISTGTDLVGPHWIRTGQENVSMWPG